MHRLPFDARQARRDFLRSLVSLPLIGGSVSLIGAPTAAAAAVTPALLRRYCDFLSRELLTATAEADRLAAPWRHFGAGASERWDLGDCRSFIDRIPPVAYLCPEGEASRAVAAAPPSTRAAVVLAAAGVPLP